MANYFGKRPVFVFSSLLLCVTFIWGANAQSFESLLWSNIVGAFAGSSTEALGAAIVNDLYFLHERGAKMGIYMNSISGGNTIGPLICGFVVQSLGWRWHKWIAVIFTAINFFAVLLFVPETRFNRDVPKSLGATASDQAIESSSEEDVDVEKTGSSSVKPVPGLPAPEQVQVPNKSFAQQLSLWSGVPSDTNLFKMFIRPLPMIVYPAVMFAFLGYAVSLAWVVAVNILNSFVLQAPPYNWQPQINGLINIPGLIGNIFGAYAESRLYLLIIPFIVTPAGCILFGYGVQRTLHWTSLFFGYGMISVALTAVSGRIAMFQQL